MESDKEKNINCLLDKMMKNSKLEKPSPSFTNNVMAEIDIIESKKIQYKPLISNKSWIIIAGIIVTILVSLNFVEFQSHESFLKNYFNFSLDYSFNSINLLFKYNPSNVFIYGILLFGLMFAIQILLIKKLYIKKKYYLN